MNSFELNKVLGAVLGTCLVLVAMHIASGAIFTPTTPAKPGYVIEVKAEQPAAGAPAAPTDVPIEGMLASASIPAGTSDTKVCLTCHTFGKGEANKIGPNLFGVLDENIAAVPGYTFSSALLADKDKKWDPDELNIWLFHPQDFAKGTKMTFAGLPKEQDRADVIAYLLTLK